VGVGEGVAELEQEHSLLTTEFPLEEEEAVTAAGAPPESWCRGWNCLFPEPVVVAEGRRRSDCWWRWRGRCSLAEWKSPGFDFAAAETWSHSVAHPKSAGAVEVEEEDCLVAPMKLSLEFQHWMTSEVAGLAGADLADADRPDLEFLKRKEEIQVDENVFKSFFCWSKTVF